MFFPIDPGADASLGGMAATRASGTNAVRYGTMKDNVLALKAVLANGEVLTTARRARKSAAGYDLTRLFVGSEGTLGVITEITLKLSGIPEAIAAGICPFPSVEAACKATIATIQTGIPVARIELLDALQVEGGERLFEARAAGDADAVASNSTAARPASPSSRSASARSPPSAAAARSSGRPGPRTARGCGRRAMTPIGPARRCGPAPQAIATDVCVPISRLAECVDGDAGATSRRAALSRRSSAMSATAISTSRCWSISTTPTRFDRAKGLLERLVERALAMDGTCTGEHGVGQGKMKYLAAEHGERALAPMRAVKQALDPQNIMNPGKDRAALSRRAALDVDGRHIVPP